MLLQAPRQDRQFPGGRRPARGAPETVADPVFGRGPAIQNHVLGQLSRRLADQLKLRQDIFVAELALEPLLKNIEGAHAALKFTPILRFPAVERDFALILNDGTAFAQVESVIRALNIP